MSIFSAIAFNLANEVRRIVAEDPSSLARMWSARTLRVTGGLLHARRRRRCEAFIYGARFRNTARAGAPSCPPTFIGSTIKS